LTAAILAGGENRRIPFLKAFLTVGGRTIIERTLDVLKRVFTRIVINTNDPEHFFRFGLPLVGDIKKERGPLTGIFSVLTATGDDAVFVVACDMPWISEELIRYMIERYNAQTEDRDRGYDAVIPLFQGKTEPLFGVYTRRIAKVMEKMVTDGRTGVNELLEKSKVLYVREEEVRSIDSEGKSFVNINTMEDYQRIGGASCSV
jgi:molybdopterin-guanine dinucleotide biosynthesis protein A